MGRAIVRNPKVFLFDEPLSNLDAKLRVQMRTEIKKLHQKVRTTTVYVTHDQVEAMTLADRVVVMNARPDRADRHAARALPHRRRREFVAGFIGSPAMNFLPCRLEEAARRASGPAHRQARLPGAGRARRRAIAPHVGKRKLMFGLRPEHIIETARATSSPASADFDAKLDVVEPMGMETMVYFIVNGAEVCGRVNPNAGAGRGRTMKLRADLNNMHLIDNGTGKVL